MKHIKHEASPLGPTSRWHRAMRFLWRWRWLLGVALVAGLLALWMRPRGEDQMTLELVGHNHTDDGIYGFAVNGAGGPYLGPHSGGGNFTCCISIPRTYRPGMTVTVATFDFGGANRRERIVEVPPYRPTDGGQFSVHFLRSGEIKVFATLYTRRHPNYPLQGEEAQL